MLFTYIAVLIALQTISDYAVEAKSCIMSNGAKGYCSLPEDCPVSDPSVGSLSCGHGDNNSKLLCCKANERRKNPFVRRERNINRHEGIIPKNNIIETRVPRAVSPTTCQTPNGDEADCIEITKCHSALSILINVTLPEIRYLKESRCSYDAKNNLIYVCCGANMTFKSEERENANFSQSALLPKDVCGIQNSSLENRVFGGQDTEINEFPWLALLEYLTDNNESVFSSGGTLISSRYVLTAAHCIIGSLGSTLINIRLGEWDYESKDPMCSSTNVTQKCKSPPLNVGFESLHSHPQYDPQSRLKYHDIGLIRLNKEIVFTDHIRPICLPNYDDYLMPGERLTIAGWGLKNFNEQTHVAQKVELPVIPISTCSYIMFNLNEGKLGKGQFCAGGESGKDSCAGDSGMPLMKYLEGTMTTPTRWYAYGIVSFGRGCGLSGLYGIYTKVTEYLPWIHSIIVI